MACHKQQIPSVQDVVELKDDQFHHPQVAKHYLERMRIAQNPFEFLS
jgi:hypothetical protein